MGKHLGDVSLPTDFELAAQACGHDASTVTGASNARADHRVWDFLDAVDIVVAEAEAHTRAYRTAEAQS